MLLDRNHSALVLVDYQKRLMPVIDDAQTVVAEALFLAQVANLLQVPVIGTEQNPERLGLNDERVRALCAETLTKHHFNAATDGLIDSLDALPNKIKQVVLAGCETHVCLLQTVLGLQRAGFHVAVVPQASGSRRPADKALGLQRMVQQGVVPVNPEMVAFEWVQSCQDPQFRAVLDLIKQRPVE